MMAMSSRPELVNERARKALRGQMSQTVLREIHDMWQDEGFPEPPVEKYPDGAGGERATLFQAYMDQVDWTDPSQVVRALRVFETSARDLLRPATAPWGIQPNPDVARRLRRLFHQDGIVITAEGEFIPPKEMSTAVVSETLLSSLPDSAVIHDHLDRIAAAIERNDPAQAIGSAKELIESTAKVVLRETGTGFSQKADLPDLVKRSQQALMVHPATQPAGPDGSGGVRKILGAASTVAMGMAELRNTYGTGHGTAEKRSGLTTRHARLAVNSARLWCEFMLDTLADPKAPWRARLDDMAASDT